MNTPNYKQISIAIARGSVNPALCFAVMMLLVMYGYFLSMTVVHVVVQKDYAYERSELTSKITMLESEYMVAQHHISERVTNSPDLLANENKVFISRTTPSLVLSSRDGG